MKSLKIKLSLISKSHFAENLLTLRIILIPIRRDSIDFLIYCLKKPFYISYADGVYALYRVEYVKKCVSGKHFEEEFFDYVNDVVLSLILLDCGYSSVSLPEVVGGHLRSPIFGKLSTLTWYLTTRNRTTLTLITNSR